MYSHVHVVVFNQGMSNSFLCLEAVLTVCLFNVIIVLKYLTVLRFVLC